MLFLRTAITTILLLLSSFLNAAGYVDKDHYLYPIMVDIRNKKYDEAMAKLEPYALKGDAQALFWYGYMKQSNWGRDRFAAYRWYEKSIAGGNPYGMFKLSGEDNTGYVCEVNGWECSENNLEKALGRWKELAENGDARAEYYYWFYNRSFFKVGFDTWLTDNNQEAIIRAAKKGYYLPLARSTIFSNTIKEDYQERWGVEMYQTLLDNFEKDPRMATYVAAYVDVDISDEERVQLLIDSLRKGYYAAAKHLYSFIDKGVVSYQDSYFYSSVANLGGAEDATVSLIRSKKVLTDKEMEGLELKAKVFFENIKHVINFDEMDFMYFSEPDV